MLKSMLQLHMIHIMSLGQCCGFTTSFTTFAVSPMWKYLSSSTPSALQTAFSYDYGYSDDVQTNRIDSTESFFATPKHSRPLRPSQSPNQSSLVPLGRPDSFTNNDVKTSLERWEEVEASATVQGNSLKTYSFDTSVDRVELFMKSEGRPVNAELALWQGPINTPSTYKVYLEDGKARTFHAIIETPGGTNSIAIRNIASAQYPLMSGIDLEKSGDTRSPAYILNDQLNYPPKTVQGGAVYTVPFKRNVDSVQISLCTDGCPMKAKIELLQGPDNNKQVMEIDTEDGRLRPFYAIVDTPGAGNVIRIINTSCIEFPLYANIELYSEKV